MDPKSNNIKLLASILVVLISLVSLTNQQPVFDEAVGPSQSQKQRAQPEGDTTVVTNNNAAQQEPGFRRTLKNAMSVSVPVFYDMIRNGTSMGINVLSGLVKVERGEEATRNGLQGSRPLSVRVFGVPVYERGQRVRPPNDDGGSLFSGLGGFGGGGGRPKEDFEPDATDELPEP